MLICVFFPPPEFHCWKMGTIINCFHQNCIVETRKYSYSLHWYCAIKHSDKVGCRTLLKKSVWKAGKKVDDRISGLATIWSSSFGFFEWIVSDMKKNILDKFEQVWTSLNKLEQVWTSLNKFEQHTSISNQTLDRCQHSDTSVFKKRKLTECA